MWDLDYRPAAYWKAGVFRAPVVIAQVTLKSVYGEVTLVRAHSRGDRISYSITGDLEKFGP